MKIKQISDTSIGIIHNNIKIKCDYGEGYKTEELTTKMEDFRRYPTYKKDKFVTICKLTIDGICLNDTPEHLVFLRMAKVKNNVIHEEGIWNKDKNPKYPQFAIISIVGHARFLIKSSIGISWKNSPSKNDMLMGKNPKEAKIINDLTYLIELFNGMENIE